MSFTIAPSSKTFAPKNVFGQEDIGPNLEN